ncbi:endonuclease/exonuclease/phosphatase family protein [Paraglaciecola aestuariivivens]
MWEFPRVQIACLAFLCALLVLVFGSGYLSNYLVGINLAVTMYQLIWIWPYTVFYPIQVPKAKSTAATQSIKILTSNVLMPNRSANKLLDLVKQYQPDILVTLETDTWWQNALADLAKDYPHRVSRPLDNLYGMHLYSKFPLLDVQVKDLIEDHVPSIHCSLVLANQQKVQCHFLHPAPPSPTENERATPRDKELMLVAKSLKDVTHPVIVTGDLNDVAWSPTTRAFRQVSGLQDPRLGRGMYNTFHAQIPFLRWPLDHIFHSSHFELAQLKRLSSIDSDHFPLFSELVFVAASKDSSNNKPPS